ncbi:helix-turn-helix domain-containing protein [Azotobacter beijerinckii]|uniref:helix-turn-helix domain-containing protein n=1 Tax=Azotobacter beijerinckii TaxID=170623 RepID=UPI000B838556
MTTCACQYRVDPAPEHAEPFAKAFGCVRFVYRESPTHAVTLAGSMERLQVTQKDSRKSILGQADDGWTNHAFSKYQGSRSTRCPSLSASASLSLGQSLWGADRRGL